MFFFCFWGSFNQFYYLFAFLLKKVSHVNLNIRFCAPPTIMLKLTFDSIHQKHSKFSDPLLTLIIFNSTSHLLISWLTNNTRITFPLINCYGGIPYKLKTFPFHPSVSQDTSPYPVRNHNPIHNNHSFLCYPYLLGVSNPSCLHTYTHQHS